MFPKVFFQELITISSHPPRRNERNGHRGPGDPPGNGRYTHRTNGCGGPHGIPGGGDD